MVLDWDSWFFTRWVPGLALTICNKIIDYYFCFFFIYLFSDRTTWAKVYGTKYSRGYAIIVDIRHGIPSFGEIKEVLILDGSEVLLQYTALSVLEYVTHLNAYKVTPGNKVSYIKQAELVDFHPLGKCRGFGCYASNFFVVLKYRIDCLQ